MLQSVLTNLATKEIQNATGMGNNTDADTTTGGKKYKNKRKNIDMGGSLYNVLFNGGKNNSQECNFITTAMLITIIILILVVFFNNKNNITQEHLLYVGIVIMFLMLMK